VNITHTISLTPVEIATRKTLGAVEKIL